MIPKYWKSKAVWSLSTLMLIASAVAIWCGSARCYGSMDVRRAAQLRGGAVGGCAGPCTEHFNPPDWPSCHQCVPLGDGTSVKCTTIGTYFECRKFVGSFCQECCPGTLENCGGTLTLYIDAVCTPPGFGDMGNCARFTSNYALSMFCPGNCP